MGLWRQDQLQRLRIEKRVFQARYSEFTFVRHGIDGIDHFFVRGWWRSKLREYQIVIELPLGYPDQAPATYIADPFPLRGRVKALHEYAPSHEMHVLQSNRLNWTRVCTFNEENWSSENTIEQALTRTLLWVQAFEGHLASGKPISYYLSNDH